jgi:hypothetical protein
MENWRIFTAEAQRGRGATENRNISRKDAKGAKAGDGIKYFFIGGN